MPVPLLLAPAGSREAVTAALGAGADAVYVGLKGWSRGGARRELDREELASAWREAASAGRTLQVAINTIPKPREREELFDRVAALSDLGIDEVIVNDVGILASLRRRFPHLRLTAGIGCGAQTSADVAFFRDLGAHAVVLPGTLSPEEAREIKNVAGIAVEIMIHMVEEFILLGKCWMPSYVHLKPSPLEAPSSRRPADFHRTPGGVGDAPEGAHRGMRQTGSMKRGGMGACFPICQQTWDLFADGRRVDSRLHPSRQISRVGEVQAYAAAGVDVLKLQGRSLPAELLGPLVRRYRDAIDARDAGFSGVALPAALPSAWAVVGR